MQSLLTVILAGAALPLAAAGASPGAVAPGEYVQGRGFGTVSIGPLSKGQQRFEIHTADVRLQICSLAGSIGRGVARVPAQDESGKACLVRFTSTGEGIEVSAQEEESEACRSFCTSPGVMFTGTFVKSIPACKDEQVEAQRKSFKKLYDQKAYRKAVDLLRPLLDRCGDQRLGMRSEGWIRNDLAVAYHKQGRDEDCREVLSPLADDATAAEDAVMVGWDPDITEELRPMLRAARHNLKLCAEPPASTETP